MTTIIMRTSEGDMRVMLLLWDATSGNRSLKIVEIPIKNRSKNTEQSRFSRKIESRRAQNGTLFKISGVGNYSFF